MSGVLSVAAACVAAFLIGAVARRSWALCAFLVCFPAAVLFLYAGLSPSMAGEPELTAVRGRVISAEAKPPMEEDLVFRLDGFDREFEYLDWYPRSREVREALQPGVVVTVWVPKDKPGAETEPTIWRIDKGEGTIVSREELADKRQSNAIGFAIMGCGLMIVSALFLVYFLSYRKRPEGTASPTEATAQPVSQ